MKEPKEKKLVWKRDFGVGHYLPIPKEECKTLLEGWDEMVWDVKTDKDGSGFICRRQEDAEILSMLLQINERLKRIEKKVR